MTHTHSVNNTVTYTTLSELRVCAYNRYHVGVPFHDVLIGQTPCRASKGSQMKHFNRQEAWYWQKDLYVTCRDKHDGPCFSSGKCFPYLSTISEATQKEYAGEGLNCHRVVIAPVPPSAISVEHHLHCHCARNICSPRTKAV
jgi:hypothetical protein